jgi:hypothetical protein
MEVKILEVILQYGGLGAVLCIVGWAYFKKDLALTEAGKTLQAEQQRRIDDGVAAKEDAEEAAGKYAEAIQAEQARRIADAQRYAKDLQEEQGSRIADAKDYHKLALQLQESVISAVNKLSDIVAVFEKRESAREMRDEMRASREGQAPR